VQPSKKRRADADYDTPEAVAAREAARAKREATWTGTRPTPTGRRKSSIPVIEIARAARKDDAVAGLERWKQRHPEAASHLEDKDVLVDSMRGRSTTWTRIRVNLVNVPPEARPPQEPLDPDYDPWAGYEWPDRAGQLERAPRKKAAPR
jgi:bifunctional non-homologous end joining protein LigD